MATNELPLAVEDNESSPPIKFTNPLAISEDAELETDEPTVIPSFKTPADTNDSKKLVYIDTNKNSSLKHKKNFRYRWRIDLAKSEKFWTGWFEGLSQKFLDLPVPKLLLLASIDGLDRTLTVGQMQGINHWFLCIYRFVLNQYFVQENFKCKYWQDAGMLYTKTDHMK